MACERPIVIVELAELLWQRGRAWEVVAPQWTLRLFLQRGGDHAFWLGPGGERDESIFESSGGNSVDWELVEPDVVELRFQHGDPGPVRIRLEVLWAAIERVAASRR